ncbi:MAG TPA: hypothetical protein VNL18_06355 [Gemmatimonadales bacterium]|nr:hypothetical protein [Gemmatimonadales bacterium]
MAVAPLAPYVATVELEDRWTDVFRTDAAVHVAIMASIVFGTFQGYLKDRIPGFLPYSLADACFVLAAGFWFASLVIRREPIRGPGIVPAVVLGAVLVPLLYMLHPGSPVVLRVAGLRAWAEFPVALLMALTIIRSPGQLRAYIGLILALCVITAVYGIQQYRAGPETALSTELARIRHGTTVFYGLPGSAVSEFRAYSTFTFPAPFAQMMVFGILLAAGVALGKTRPRGQRLVAALLVPLFFVGITVSGTRAAVIVLLLGLLVIARYRGLATWQVLMIPLGLLGLYGSSLLTAGRVFERWQTIVLQEGLLWTYVYAPVTIAARALDQAPFGLGLGRSGVGVPFQIVQSYRPGFIQGSDGDIGRAAVEMGVVGVLLVIVLMVSLLPYAVRALRHLRGSPDEDAAVGAGALVVATGVLLLIGSPLSSAPHATIWWFMLGALLKLQVLNAERSVT